MASEKTKVHYLRAATISGLLWWLAAPVWACRVCRPKVQATIHAPDYSQNLLLILLPVAVLVLLGVALFFADSLTRRFTSALHE